MAKWLVGVDLGLAVGILVSVSEFTEILGNTMLYDASVDYGVAPALMLGAVISVGSLSITVLASALDLWGTNQLPEPPKRGMSYFQKSFDTPPPTLPSPNASYATATPPTTEAPSTTEAPALGTSINTNEFISPSSMISTSYNNTTSRRELIALLVVATFFIIPAGALNRGQNGLENLLYFAAAAGPIVGWAIDRLGRTCLFLAVGATLQLASLLASIVAAATLHGSHLDAVGSAVVVGLGIAWAMIICGAWTSLALLVPAGWMGFAYATVIAMHAIAVSIVPFYAYAPSPMAVWIPTAVSTFVGLCLVGRLYQKRSVLNMNAHDIRRVVGYAGDYDDEKSPLLPNSPL